MQRRPKGRKQQVHKVRLQPPHKPARRLKQRKLWRQPYRKLKPQLVRVRPPLKVRQPLDGQPPFKTRHPYLKKPQRLLLPQPRLYLPLDVQRHHQVLVQRPLNVRRQTRRGRPHGEHQQVYKPEYSHPMLPRRLPLRARRPQHRRAPKLRRLGNQPPKLPLQLKPVLVPDRKQI